jgi:hypothetical protein
MMHSTSPKGPQVNADGQASSHGPKIPKACEPCRRRKIRCDGAEHCLPCQQRGTLCVYRNVVRQRKRKADYLQAEKATRTSTATPLEGLESSSRSFAGTKPMIHSSVLAQHTSHLGDTIESWFGPSSDFALMQLLYRDLYLPAHDRNRSYALVEDGNDGLDTLDFRRIFFSLDESKVDAAAPAASTMPATFLFMSFEVARDLLDKYLNTYHTLAPFNSKEAYHHQLRQIYNRPFSGNYTRTDTHLLLMALATAALSTKHWRWAETIYQEVKRMQDNGVSLRSVQICILMMSPSIIVVISSC